MLARRGPVCGGYHTTGWPVVQTGQSVVRNVVRVEELGVLEVRVGAVLGGIPGMEIGEQSHKHRRSGDDPWNRAAWERSR